MNKRKQIMRFSITLLVALFCGCNIELFNKIETYKKENIHLWAYRIGNTRDISVTTLSIYDGKPAEIKAIKKLPEFSIKLKDGTVIKSENFTFDYLSKQPSCRLYVPKITEDIQRQIDYGFFKKEEFQCKYLLFPGYKFQFSLKGQLEYIYIGNSADPKRYHHPEIGARTGTVFFRLPTKFANIKGIFGDDFILTSSHW